MSTMPLVTGTTVGPTDPSELQIYNGGGQKPNDVNLFLSYTNPLEHRNPIRAAETRFPLSIRYGATVLPPTFKATLNGTDVTASFRPAVGSAEVVTIVLQSGSNTVVLSIDGKTASGRTATDTDRLVLLVSP